jgi:hypothetical protein
MTRNARILVVSLALVLVVGMVFGQRRSRRGGGFGGGGFRGDPANLDPSNRNGVPTWEVDANFKSDLFTFVRIQYNSEQRYYSWQTDFPDSDLNFTFRLQQLTSLKVDPNWKILELSDDALFDYPFIYMLEVAGLEFTEQEIIDLRRYLLNGGFLMVDDFWGDYALERFREQMKRVFPDKDLAPLDMNHPIFHCVYDLKEKPQVPGIDMARANRGTGRTDERGSGPAEYYGLFDDKGRMMAIICHNTDLGDGWEREGEEEWYFHEFSEKKAYPMGINIVFYAMTH